MNLTKCTVFHCFRLRDDSLEVRSTAVTILTHLILNDMVKVKGQISEMAVCLEDKEEKISTAAKLFFFELSQKVGLHKGLHPTHLTDNYITFFEHV